jgi:adenylate kinase
VRTVPQAEGLERVLHELGRRVDAVLMFDVDEDELVRRISGRVVCEGCQTPYTGLDAGAKCAKCGGMLVRRKDDEPEAVRNRMRAYREQTAPVVEWYRSRADGAGAGDGAPRGPRFIDIDAAGPVDEITQRVLRELVA